ncbi:MAG: hypothetical protein AAGJ08_21685 [Cyanobacteria bacterium P01_H01_bin.35]
MNIKWGGTGRMPVTAHSTKLLKSQAHLCNAFYRLGRGNYQLSIIHYQFLNVAF